MLNLAEFMLNKTKDYTKQQKLMCNVEFKT